MTARQTRRQAAVATGPAIAFLPIEERPPWQAFARCAETDPEIFFPEQGQGNSKAKRVCMQCEVRIECLNWALDHHERYGIWGGATERERRAILRARRRKAAKAKEAAA